MQLISPNGVRVSVSDDKAESLIARGFKAVEPVKPAPSPTPKPRTRKAKTTVTETVES